MPKRGTILIRLLTGLFWFGLNGTRFDAAEIGDAGAIEAMLPQ